MINALDDDEVHVWLASPADVAVDSCREQCLAILSADERARYERYRHEPSRDQFLAARALLRRSLSRYAAATPAAWQFVANRYGRPELAPGSETTPLRFNVSHTTRLVACAVVRERDIGIDVEFVNRRSGGVHLAERFFSATEVDALHQVAVDRQRSRFFDYWTLKESYIKARGMGLALPLGQFSFHLAADQFPTITFDARLVDDPDRWQFWQTSPTEEHRLALAVRAPRAQRLRVQMQTIALG